MNITRRAAGKSQDLTPSALSAMHCCASCALPSACRCMLVQGLPGSLPEAAAADRRRRRLLERSQDPGYTAGSGFDMSALQRKSDVVSQCTQSVLCDKSVDDIEDAVVDIYAINLQLGAMAVCTGDIPILDPCQNHKQPQIPF